MCLKLKNVNLKNVVSKNQNQKFFSTSQAKLEKEMQYLNDRKILIFIENLLEDEIEYFPHFGCKKFL